MKGPVLVLRYVCRKTVASSLLISDNLHIYDRLTMDHSTRRMRSSLIFVAVLVVALAGIVARPPGFSSTFWPANAILLGILLRNPRSFAPLGLVAGAGALMTAELATGTSVQPALELNAVDLIGIVTGLATASLLGCFPRRMSEMKYATRILLVSILASAAAGSASALRTQLHEGSGAATELVVWFFADLCTYLIVLPGLLSAPRSYMFVGLSVPRSVRVCGHASLHKLSPR
ncbi:hypothetical protein PXH69_32430 [Rhodococcus qingshengii]|uniref:MASE1 domain-containing protein n=1 Tax=Rhodococcus qingshengii TaxID=334542 RepID=A0AAW6LRA9_RHOSG|nr:hypothetical protein [Rhodococcus qingshengii]MDE8649683.1 hypothetical protein [Rhodococcus qingshengii]